MTLPAERTKSVVDTRAFLEMLASDEQVTIPGLVQSVALCLLKHFPSSIDLRISASSSPQVWAPPSSRELDKPRLKSVRIVGTNGTGTDSR